jgi:small subunit ribosomal protein S15
LRVTKTIKNSALLKQYEKLRKKVQKSKKLLYLPLERWTFVYITIIYNNIRMYLSKQAKEEMFAKHGNGKNDTGSAEGQIALFTQRINHLTEHLKKNRKDYNTERSLVKLVGKRRSLLDYLTKKDILRYRAIVKELGLRK